MIAGSRLRHAGGVQLADHDVPEPVDHEARQAVGLGVHQAIVGLVEQPLAQPQGPREAPLDERGVDGRVLVARDHAGGDQGMRD